MAPSPHDAALVAVDLPAPERHLPFYGLASAPFKAGVDPGRLWLGPEQRALLDTLAGTIRDREGIVLLTGDVATGKTTLAQRLVATLGRPGFTVGWVSSPGSASPDFFEAVLSAYGVRQPVQNRSAFAAVFERVLARAGATGSRVLLVIDEAQGLSDEVLDEIGALAAMASGRDGSLAILLVGETRLDAALGHERHAVLRERVVARCPVPALRADEVGVYVRHCLDAAGSVTDIFDANAIRRIAELSAGAPGTINIICDRALLAGRAQRARPITAAIVDECYPAPGARAPKPAARQPWTRRPVSFPPAPRRRGRVYVTAAATVLLVTGAPYLAWWLIGLDGGKVRNASRQSVTVRSDDAARAVPASVQADRASDAAPTAPPADLAVEIEAEARPSMAALDVPVTLPARALSVRPRSVQARETRSSREARPTDSLAGAPVPAPSSTPRVSAPAPAAPASVPAPARVASRSPAAAVPSLTPAPQRAVPAPASPSVSASPLPPVAHTPAVTLSAPATARVPRPFVPPADLAPVARSGPQDVPVSRPPARELRADAPDPSAVIDWLVEKSPGKRTP
jgi:general secretion pathway protein A